MKPITAAAISIAMCSLIGAGSGPGEAATSHTTPGPAPASAVQQGRVAQAMSPDEFELKGTGVEITYSTTSFVGTPRLNYTHGGKHKTFTGTEIQSESTALGQLVTVTLEAIPDYKSDILTLVIPQINLEGNDGHFGTFAVLTTERTSRGGPSGVRGPVQSYQVIQLQGVAKSVVF
ncbi:MAG: hypothetical protein M3Y56_05525 [Armatimonadota bacterium]|nr:hypothetical protein [Armatimonadota bacterium]